MLSDNAMYEAFGERALFQATYGGAELGDCTSTVERVGDGSIDDWYREWVATAVTARPGSGTRARSLDTP